MSGIAWDAAYVGTPPWDIGGPQQAFADLAAAGGLTGRVLDVGCGTGELTLLAASAGADATGVDISPRAIARARAKARARGIHARFEVVDVLRPDGGWMPEPFDTVVDSGTFHMFDAAGRAAYARTVTPLVREGGCCRLLCTCTDRGRSWGPAGVAPDDIATAFGDGWTLEAARPAGFVVGAGAPVTGIPARLVTLRRAAAAPAAQA